MTEQPAVPAVTQIVIPPKPRPTRELEIEADMAVRYLEQFTSSSRLDPDLRMAMTDIRNTIKNLKSTVVRQSEEAQRSHNNLVEVVQSQRLIG